MDLTSGFFFKIRHPIIAHIIFAAFNFPRPCNDIQTPFAITQFLQGQLRLPWLRDACSKRGTYYDQQPG